jgi:hypothetical protein
MRVIRGAAVQVMHERQDQQGRTHRRPERYPADLACGPAFVLPLAFCAITGRTGAPIALAGQVAVLVGLVAVAGWVTTAPAGAVAIGTSSLSLNGFGENGLGVLSLHPRVDATVLAVLVAAWALAWVARETEPHRHASRGRGDEGGSE